MFADVGAGFKPAPATSRPNLHGSESLRPSTSAVEDAQDLDGIANHAIWNDEGRPRDHELTRSRNPAGPPYSRVGGKQCFNIPDDVMCDALRSCRIILLDVGA